MTQIKCKKCGEQIDIKAKKCPACDAPVEDEWRDLFLGMGFGLVLVACLAFAAYWYFFMSSGKIPGKSNLAATSQNESGDAHQAWIDRGKQQVINSLKDPESVNFRSVRFVQARIDGRSIPAVIGEVNAKNSYGGYVGFQRFIVYSDLLVFENDLSSYDRSINGFDDFLGDIGLKW